MTREEAHGDLCKITLEPQWFQQAKLCKLINKIYDDFEEQLDKAIVEAEDSGWMTYIDKSTCIDILYELKEAGKLK